MEFSRIFTETVASIFNASYVIFTRSPQRHSSSVLDAVCSLHFGDHQIWTAEFNSEQITLKIYQKKEKSAFVTFC